MWVDKAVGGEFVLSMFTVLVSSEITTFVLSGDDGVSRQSEEKSKRVGVTDIRLLDRLSMRGVQNSMDSRCCFVGVTTRCGGGSSRRGGGDNREVLGGGCSRN